MVIDKGKFIVLAAMPELNIPGHPDHGYEPLALIADSFMAPDTWITMHEHVQDEIISYVPQCVMRRDDRTTGKLIAEPNHLMVMNAGRSFWHEEHTLAGEPPLRMLQIFVRPHTLDLEPTIQHGPLVAPEPNRWRHLVGPEGSAAPFFVRNDVDIYDIRLEAGASTMLPLRPGWSWYFFVYAGRHAVRPDREQIDGRPHRVDPSGYRNCDRRGVRDQPRGFSYAGRHDWGWRRPIPDHDCSASGSRAHRLVKQDGPSGWPS
ncbi:pirin family protein [Microvirga yunnanensis]|uniref:pirin family protein n=1 Tax=Microvirga yunnanensis TaxID=2953740 RepID=UPI0021C80B13|nr:MULTISPECIES: pirin family protein [unclassified Microvirga]